MIPHELCRFRHVPQVFPHVAARSELEHLRVSASQRAATRKTLDMDAGKVDSVEPCQRVKDHLMPRYTNTASTTRTIPLWSAVRFRCSPPPSCPRNSTMPNGKYTQRHQRRAWNYTGKTSPTRHSLILSQPASSAIWVDQCMFVCVDD